MSDRRIVFKCPKCSVTITRPLLSLGPDKSICLEDGKPAVPEGFFTVNNQEYWCVAGDVVVNLADLVGTKHHQDYRRRNGCCGLDGMDGPNLVCPNGHEVGTEKSDCWMPHAAVLLENVSGVNEC